MKWDNFFKGCLSVYRGWLYCISAGLLIMMSESHVLAHKVILFAYTEGEKVFTESYFNDGKRCRNSTIEVFDNTGKKLLEGKTNNDGEFSFKTPGIKDLRLVLTASMGHRAEYTVSARDFRQSGEKGMSSSVQGEVQKDSVTIRKEPAVTGQNSPVDSNQIRSLMEEVLDKKMRPVMKLLAESREPKVSFTQIIGGIGYIFGILGVIMYFKSKGDGG